MGFLPRGKRLVRLWGLGLVALLVSLLMALPASAQFSGSDSSSSYSLGWIEIDGREVFQVAAPSSALSQRQQHVKENLETILQDYLEMEEPMVNIATVQQEGYDVPSIYVNGEYLVTVTQEDALLQGTTPAGFVEELETMVTEALTIAYRQRQPENIRAQAVRSGIVIGLALLVVVMLEYWRDSLFRLSLKLLGQEHRLNTDHRHHLHDIQIRLWPLLQGAILVGSLVWALGHFPNTRSIQNDLLTTAKVPLILAIVVVIAYVGIRLSYATIDQFVTSLSHRDEDAYPGSRRTNLRISTISSVIKNIANFVWIIFGLLIALSITGINLGLLLASVGIIGLALSLAAQNLVSGAIKGFFIVLEDQYAIGDVVKIGDDAGLVEKMNLRITQLRDTAGRLITIPTSDIDRVANFSLHWSRSDLKIPIHYNADLDQMIGVAQEVGSGLKDDPEFGLLILEDPQILGVDDFGDSALILRVWIKTQPMKQWDVSREFRRRFKLAIEAAGSEIPFPQRDVWLHSADEFNLRLDRELESERDDSSNGHHKADTDRQPEAVPGGDASGEEGEANPE